MKQDKPLMESLEEVAALPYTKVTLGSLEELAANIPPLYSKLAMLEARLNKEYKQYKKNREAVEAQVVKKLRAKSKERVYGHHIEQAVNSSTSAQKAYALELRAEKKLNEVKAALDTYRQILSIIPAFVGRGTAIMRNGGY